MVRFVQFYFEPEEYLESCQAPMSSVFQGSCVTLAYLESWYIQNLRNIQNTVKLLCSNIFLMSHGIYTMKYSEPYANITFKDS